MDHAESSSASKLDAPFQASSALLSRRRKGNPSRKPSISPVTDQGSPEVISSLISSLSTISVPLQSHFDSGPRIDSETDPTTPIYIPPEPHSIPDQQRPPSEHGFGVTYTTTPVAVDFPHSPFLHPDDAAAAPIIRMARAPPSPKSPKSPKSPRFKSAFSAPPSPGRPTSRGSYTSFKAGYEDTAFGMISTEPGHRASTAASIASTGSRKSLKTPLGLFKKPSREFLCGKDKESEKLRKSNSYNDSLRQNMPRNRASLRSMHSMANVAEEGRQTYSTDSSRQPPPSSPNRERSSFQSLCDSAPSTPGGVGSGRAIPARESSLRHSFSSSSRQRKGSRHGRLPSGGSNREAKVDSGIAGVGSEAEQVTKRIQELKNQQQKIKTELEMDDSPEISTKHLPSPKPVRPPQNPSGVGAGVGPAEARRNRSYTFDESAPAPAVMTGKCRSMTKTSSPLVSKPANVPFATRGSFDKCDQASMIRARQSVESSTPPRNHRRSPSGPTPTGQSVAGDYRPSSADSIDHLVFDYIQSPKLTQRVPHPTTGRTIAFSEVGDPRGHVVLCCLGMGLTRYLMAFYDELARSLKLRMITLDRPGVGESGPCVDESGNPLSWPDDVAIVCNYLKVTKFSILAHSAGAIYALATALRIPQHIRGRIHLLAPWIPPSQLSSIGSQKSPAPTNAVPYSQRILRALPTSFLKVANSSFMSATSASITTSLPKSPRRSKRKGAAKDASASAAPDVNGPQKLQSKIHQQGADLQALQNVRTPNIPNEARDKEDEAFGQNTGVSDERERQSDYDNRLTHKIWELATSNANPAVDLLVCLERHQPIGFRYVDITRNVVIHHGSRDTRVPVDNVRWLGQTMRRCEVRVLEDEGHGLMASASVMGNVMMEIAKEWEDWMIVVQGRRRGTTGMRPGLMIQT
ncbi:alpha/beta-hydrolase [Aspergillus candidus]|uniref:Alpha/beta-hydrolase n=1 Tax=Aspergillus candidus TaxID=41067 RepID=A0A2I2F1T9_ASPCN|nr:alpha/beta-hydrolase [Aspergillus candidus]PLB34600.1 alpha/beta-hydrolase [Aspergillus candidus]